MGIKSKRVAFTFDDSSVRPLTPEELAQLRRTRLCPCCLRPMAAHPSPRTFREIERPIRAAIALEENR